MCAVPSGSWGGRCPSLAGYVTVTGAHGWGDRRRRVFMLPSLCGVDRVLLLWGSVCHHVEREASRVIPSILSWLCGELPSDP